MIELIFSAHLHRRLGQRSYITSEGLHEIVSDPLVTEIQEDGRIRLYGRTSEDMHVWRVVLEADGRTVVTAYRDRDYYRRYEKD